MENWINLFETCMILSFLTLLVFGGYIYFKQLNIWRKNDSAYKRLEIRHKREMETVLKIVEIPVKPIVLTYQSDYQKEFLDKCQDDEFYKNRLQLSIIEHFFSDVLIKNTSFERSESFFSRSGEEKVTITAKIAIIPKEHINKFK